ncbi:MAG: hypothetical protein HC772_07635 [Leptolyngbyaceae cyanobacterium CRU_2_3]|nr:hypothetical protein [Leptolyngbyaceae cyanobacterium CRU_2_3]
MADIPFRKILGLNQQSYQRLKVALSLNLRRQIFVVVCDDLVLRDRLSAQLQVELAKSNWSNFFGSANFEATAETANHPRLVSLHLNLDDPNPIVQIAQWLAQAPAPRGGWQAGTMPSFQILGAENLTRQPAAIQRLFFNHLQSIEYNLPLLESSVVLWLTLTVVSLTVSVGSRVFGAVAQSVFEFIGDPTPIMVTLPERIGMPSAVMASQAQSPKQAIAPSVSTPAPPPKSAAVENPWELLAQDLDSAHLFESFSAADANSDLVSGAQPPLNRLPLAEAAALLEAEEEQITETEWVAETRIEPAGANSLMATIPAGLQSEDLRKLPLMQQIEQLHRQQAPPTTLATAYCALGNLYRDRIEQGDLSLQNIAIAIQAYEQALRYVPEQAPLWVDILNDLGNLYWMLSRSMPTSEEALPYLQRGLQAYQLALTQINPESQPQTYPMVQNNLGAAYADLARHQDPAESLRLSVEAYLKALRYRTPETDPLRYASTQNNLGTTYWNLAQHQQPDVNLKQAIAAYSEAMRFYDPATEPFNYAMIQNNLGTACWHMANHAEDTELRIGYLQGAIVAYESTLKAAELMVHRNPGQTTPLTFDQVATQNNLGLAHYQIATDTQANLTIEQQSTHLSAALKHHLIALQLWSQKPDLRQTALTRVVETLRATYVQLGLTGQNRALSMVPGQLLPEILPRL